MYKELDVYDFVKEFRNSRFKDYFTEQGLIVLFNYIEKLEEENKENYSLDLLTLVDQFREFENIESVLEEFDLKSKEELKETYNIIEIPNTERLIVQVDNSPKPWQIVKCF